MFIIDFDDTLFDTHAFKAARWHGLEEIGVSSVDYEETYRAALALNDRFSYSDERHANLLSLRGYEKSRVEEVLGATTTPVRLQEFLFPDTVNFLEHVRNFGKPLVLLSLGNLGFQELKVKGSGIEHYFDRRFLVQESKELVIQQLNNAGERLENAWFINDKVGESLLIHTRFPVLNIILKKSPSIEASEYLTSNLPYLNTLTEIYDYITKQNG